MKSKVVFAPDLGEYVDPMAVDVFLAGSIEMGKAADWQTMLGYILSGVDSVGRIFNPRRLDWDSSWKQTPDNPHFYQQVNWELDHMEKANIVFFNFVPGTMSPITLAELGLMLGRQKYPIVCCPKDYWRAGNVEIMCKRENVLFFHNYEESVDCLIKIIDSISHFKKQGVIWN